MSWLAQLNPNTVIIVLSTMGTVAAWLYHKVRGDQSQSFDDALRGVGKQLLHALITDPDLTSETSLATWRAKAVDLIWSLASRAGIPRNAITEPLASAVIDHTIGDALAELRKLDATAAADAANVAAIARIPSQLARVAAQAQDVASTFATARAEGLARAAADPISTEPDPSTTTP